MCFVVLFFQFVWFVEEEIQFVVLDLFGVMFGVDVFDQGEVVLFCGDQVVVVVLVDVFVGEVGVVGKGCFCCMYYVVVFDVDW